MVHWWWHEVTVRTEKSWYILLGEAFQRVPFACPVSKATRWVTSLTEGLSNVFSNHLYLFFIQLTQFTTCMLFDCCTYRIPPTRLAWHVIPFPDYVFFLPSPFTVNLLREWQIQRSKCESQGNLILWSHSYSRRRRLVSLRTCQVSSRIGRK